MSNENKQEKVVAKAVYCMGIKAMILIENCNKCDHFDGIQKLPRIKKHPDGSKEDLGIIKKILCKYPTAEQIISICDLGG